jgi:hypothetical protein
MSPTTLCTRITRSYVFHPYLSRAPELSRDSSCVQWQHFLPSITFKTPTEPSRLQVTPSHPVVEPHVFVFKFTLNVHWGPVDIPVISVDYSWTRVTVFGLDDCGHRLYMWLRSSAMFFLHVDVSAWFNSIWNVFARIRFCRRSMLEVQIIIFKWT